MPSAPGVILLGAFLDSWACGKFHKISETLDIYAMIPLLTEYEKEHIAERQALPERYLGLSGRGDGPSHRRGQGHARPPAGDPRTPLSARRSDQVRRLHRRFLQARRSGQQASRRRVHRLLRRALHGRERGRAQRAVTSRSSFPTSAAGCSMADMAAPDQLEQCWADLEQMLGPGSGAGLRAFRSPTSTPPRRSKPSAASTAASSAPRPTPAATLKWAWERGEKILFLPDQHLGRNTAYKMGVPLDQMVVWDPNEIWGGLEPDAVKNARIILWKGHCSVHARFTVRQIENMRAQHPGIRVIVHPEVPWDVVQAADDSGSTEYIIKHGEREPGRIHLGRGHRDPPRQPPRAARCSLTARSSRSISSAASARRCSASRRTTCSWVLEGTRRRRGPQPHRRARRPEALDEGRARSDALHFVGAELGPVGRPAACTLPRIPPEVRSSFRRPTRRNV